MSDDVPGVLLDRRMIPFPTSISRSAADALRRMVGDDGVPRNALHHLPTANDRDGWTALKASSEAGYAETIAAAAGELRSEVATVVAGGATIHVATPEAPTRPDGAIIDLHGGALVLGGGAACRVGTRRQADLHGLRCYGVDYRTPPDHPFPAALDDCLAVYRHVLAHHAPDKVVIAGRSAGGNLAAAMLLRARDEGLPMPAGLVLLSPQVDLTESGDSFAVNRTVDVVLPGSLMASNLLYAGGAHLADPLLSPLFGDLAGFPPVFLQSGTRDLFLSNTVRMHRALRRAGVAAELHVFEAMPHGGYTGRTPEELELLGEVKAFVAARLGVPTGV